MPIPFTPQHIASLANQMVEQPYGWGGLFEYRDCSATLMDLFAPFGIWLPRNSSDQLSTWKSLSLKDLKNSEKKKRIERQGIPLRTLIGWPGHVMLYLGVHDRKIYTFHTIWGLRTTLFSGKEGRSVFGKTVITPIDIGSHYLNIKKTALDKAEVMTFPGEKAEETLPLPKKYSSTFAR